MKRIEYNRSFGGTDYRRKVIDIRFLDSLDAPEMLEQSLTGLGAYSFNRIKF